MTSTTGKLTVSSGKGIFDPEGKVGYFYITVPATTAFTLAFYQQSNDEILLTIDKLTSFAKLAMLREATASAVLLVDPTTFVEGDKIGIAAFSQNPYKDGAILAMTSTYGIPGLKYDTEANVEEISGEMSGNYGVTEQSMNLTDKNSYSYCNTEGKCRLYISLQY